MRAMSEKTYDPDFGKDARYPVSICSILNPPLLIRDGMSRVKWQPSNTHLKNGSIRSCQRRTGASGESPCSQKINRPLGFSTRFKPRMASAKPGIVRNVKVLTTVSIQPSANGIRSPGTSRNSTSRFIRSHCRFCTQDHLWVRFKRVHLAHSRRIVLHEVHARPQPDFKDFAFGKRNETFADLPHGFRVSQDCDQMEIDLISVERHAAARYHTGPLS